MTETASDNLDYDKLDVFFSSFLFLLVETKIETGGFSNRIRSLLAKLTTNEVTRQCPLIWMIYMQYCALYENDEKYKDIFHMGIENCPWVKVNVIFILCGAPARM